MGLTIDFEEDLVEVPFVTWLGTPPSELVRIALLEFKTPLPHGLIGHNDAARSQQLFDVAKAEVEAEVQPYGMGDDLLRKAKAYVRWSSDGCCYAPSMA
jgi:hypothetical protein